jgi:hypothetical protein
MYFSSPPIILLSSLLAVLKVKLALDLHNLQIAASFLTFSHFGMSSKIFEKGPLRKVPPSEATMTILPALATFSENSTISGKN